MVSSKNKLDKHILVFHSGTEYKCTNCEILYTSQTALNKHINSTHINFGCTICAKNFVSRSGLIYHTNVKHKNIVFKCLHPLGADSSGKIVQCDKEYASKINLDQHTESIHNNNQFKCMNCEQTYTFKKNLLDHQKICSSI